MPLPVNGRRYLRDKEAKGRYGSCQAPAVVEFNNVKSFEYSDVDFPAMIETMDRTCRIVKEGYDYWIGKSCNLAVGISKDNFFSQSLGS
jgi:hypothetical protein